MGKIAEKSGQMTVEQAAEIMDVTPMFLRMGMRQDKFPFGAAVKMRKQWRYYINEKRFYEWLRDGVAGKATS